MSVDEIREGFFEECDDLLAALGDGLNELDRNGTNEETINAVFRAVHSIKGGAGAFGLEALVGFSHKFENLLDGLRNLSLALSPTILALCFRAGDHLADQVEAARVEQPLTGTETSTLVEEIESALGPQLPAETAAPPVFDAMPITMDLGLPIGTEDGPNLDRCTSIQLKTMPGLFEAGHEPLLFFRRLADLGPMTFVQVSDPVPLCDLDLNTAAISWDITCDDAVPCAAVFEIFEFAEGLVEISFDTQSTNFSPEIQIEFGETIDGPPSTASKTPATANPVAPSIRVDLNRVERLNNLAGELVINQAMLMQLLDGTTRDFGPEIQDAMDTLRALSSDLQESVIAIRAQPVKPLFSRMSRIVREAAKSSQKSVRFETIGEMTEIDKTALECLADPLTHMVRNAVDHGLESSENRLAAGKPETGVVTLSAAHRSGKVVIELADDGAGINRKRVREIALRKKLISQDAVLSDAEIDNLLFLPGFSTAESVSDLSGRGVGMDVARSEIQALGGRVSIRSTQGEGTVLSITLPLTLAVLEGMIVDLAGERMVVPITAIVETMRAASDTLAQLADGAWMVGLRGQFIPLLDTAAVFGFRAPLKSYEGHPFLVVETEARQQMALIVDQISEQSQVVIKGISDHYQPIPGISAATILGDGQIALIIDPEDLAATTPDLPLQEAAE